jgi:hypothetical protein
VRRSNFRIATILNTRKPCDFPACTNRRKAVGRWCAAHMRLCTLYGHPQGHLITKAQYWSYVKMARRILKRLEATHHPALTAALDITGRLLARGPEPRRTTYAATSARYLLWRELERIEDVTPMQMLETVVGVFLFSHHQPRILPSDNRLTYQIGQAVFRLRPLTVSRSYYNDDSGKVENTYRVPSGQAVGLLGRRLRTSLAPFLANVVQTVEQQHREQAEQAMALSSALSTPLT